MQADKVVLVKEDGNVPDIIRTIKELTIEAAKHPEIKQVAADALKSGNVLKYVFDYSYDRILYVPNEANKQQLRTVWNFLRTGNGNCAIYVIMIGAVLLNLNIPYKYRVTNYPKLEKGKFIFPVEMQHVYIVTLDGTVLDPVIGQRQDGTDTRFNRPQQGKFNTELNYYKKIDYPMARIEILQGTLGSNPNLKHIITNRSKMSRYGLLSGSLGCGCGCGEQKEGLGLFRSLIDKYVRETPLYEAISTQVSPTTAENFAVPISNQIEENITKVVNTAGTVTEIASGGLINIPTIPLPTPLPTPTEQAAAQAMFDQLNNQQSQATTSGGGTMMFVLLGSALLGTMLFAGNKKKKTKGRKKR